MWKHFIASENREQCTYVKETERSKSKFKSLISKGRVHGNQRQVQLLSVKIVWST